MPFYADRMLTIWGGDCRDVMAQMPDYCRQMLNRATVNWDREPESVEDVAPEGLWST
jgi:hypothetical protein